VKIISDEVLGNVVDGNKAGQIAKAFGASDVGDAVHNITKNFVGDYLHTF